MKRTNLVIVNLLELLALDLHLVIAVGNYYAVIVSLKKDCLKCPWVRLNEYTSNRLKNE